MEKYNAKLVVCSLDIAIQYLKELQKDDNLDRNVNTAFLASKGENSFSFEAAAAIQTWCGDGDTTIKETIETLTTIKGFLKALHRLSENE